VLELGVMAKKRQSEVEIINDGKQMERFDELLRQVVKVPKKEIQEREKNASKNAARKKRS